MAEQFRPPKLVVAEGLVSKRVTPAQVFELRNAPGVTGVWAQKIAAQLEHRAAELKEILMDHRADPSAPAPLDANEPAEPAQGLYGVDSDRLADKIMAADAAMDAAQTLLEQYENDPVISQAYFLICAADSALEDVQEALGLSDPDDEMPSAPLAVDSMPMMDETRAAGVERRRITFDAELRATTDGEMRVAGYAAMFNREASGLPFREMIAPGAFTRTLQTGQPVYLLVNHDTDALPLASTSAGTMSLREDAQGLYMEANLDPANPRAQELHSVLSRGDATKMSFAFTVNQGGETRDGDLRVLTDLSLYEVSIVTWPAYDSTDVGLREGEPVPVNSDLRARMLAVRTQFFAIA
jgi:HK97 family phage prohead protease